MSSRDREPSQSAFQARKKKLQRRAQEFHAQWHRLHECCTDQESRTRLVGLREQFERQKRGVSEPAQVEVEIACLFMQAGFSVAFLEESAARTADLECYLGTNRLFVEITAILPNLSARGSIRAGVLFEEKDRFMEGNMQQEVFLRRLLARMAEKAKQLSRYCAPVVLAVTVPNDPEWEEDHSSEHELDLQSFSGILATALAGAPQLSGVLLTCWNAPAQPPRSNIRLSQAHWVARSGTDAAFPRIRLLVVNAFATYALDEKAIQALKMVL